MKTTKICRTCTKELPTSDFREGRRRCIRCEEKTYAENWSNKTHITCNKCSVEKPISDYYKGHKRCKSCYSESYKTEVNLLTMTFLQAKKYNIQYQMRSLDQEVFIVLAPAEINSKRHTINNIQL